VGKGRSNRCKIMRKTRVDSIIPGADSTDCQLELEAYLPIQKQHDSRSGRERSCDYFLFSRQFS